MVDPRIKALVDEAAAVTVLTGAGVSTASGIPDFRGPNGIWTKNPEAERLSTYQDYLADPDVRVRAWQARKANATWQAKPNPAHYALVDLERQGRLVAIATQNIDGLHQRAGNSPEKVLELHGTVWEVVCLSCRDRTPMADTLARVQAGEEDPECLLCGGILKSATISFGQTLNPAVIDAAVDAARACDVFMAVGSSLLVHPAAGLCGVAVDAGAQMIILNADATPYDGLAVVRLDDRVEQVLPELVGRSTGCGG